MRVEKLQSVVITLFGFFIRGDHFCYFYIINTKCCFKLLLELFSAVSHAGFVSLLCPIGTILKLQ